MPRHPFYKYSFFILLLVDLSYTAALSLMGMATLDINGLMASMVWFVSFFWLPVWLAATIIFTCRKKAFQNTAFEWFIAVALMSIGNTATDNLLPLLYEQYRSMGYFVILNGLLWGSGIYFICRHLESQKKLIEEKHARKQAQLATLRYQLNPHFMFNSLNTISAYIHHKPDLADEVLHELADILRYSLDTAETKTVSLQQEVEIINKYLNIEKARFGERLILSLHIPIELNTIKIPPLILQPIIENSVKHNAQKTELKISITIKNTNSKLQIIVADNGSGFSEHILKDGYGSGIGMKNLQQRINQLSSGKVKLSNNEGAVVTLEMES